MEPELFDPVASVTDVVSGAVSLDVYVVAAVIAIAVLSIARTLWARFKGDTESFDKYKSYAVMAAKYVEGAIPDNYGGGKEDGRMKRGAHKLDVFLKHFTVALKEYEGKDMNAKLKAKAMEWSVELAKDFVTPKDK